MIAQTLIADADSAFAGELEAQIKQLDLGTQRVGKPAELVEALNGAPPDILVLNASLLDADTSPETILTQVPTVIYSARMDADSELSWYERGAARVVTADSALAAHVAGAVKMVLHRRKALREYRQRNLTHGDLRTLSLAELLQNAMYDRKSLVVKVYHRNGQAKIRTLQGHVISAKMAGLRDVDALLKTLYLSSGSFVVHKYKAESQQAPLTASTPGILAEMRFQQLEIQRLLAFFRVSGNNPRLVVVHSEKIFELPRPRLKILDLVEETGTLQDILLQSPLSLLKTVRILQEFADEGLIRLHEEESTVDKKETAAGASLRKALADTIKESGTLVVLGGAGRSQLVRHLAGDQNGAVKSHQNVDLARLDLSPGVRLNILGISVEESFLPLLDRVAKSLIGCILLVDYQDKIQHEFAGYLFKRMIQLYDTSFLIALTNIDAGEAGAVAKVRHRLGMPENVPIVAIQPSRTSDLEQMIRLLAATNPQSTEERVHQKDEEEWRNG